MITVPFKRVSKYLWFVSLLMWYWQILIEFGEAQIGNQQYSNVFTRYETLIHTLCSY